MLQFIKKFWKWIVGILVGMLAFFVLWQLRRREAELLVLRARIQNMQQELKEKEALLHLSQNAKEIEDIKKQIEERKQRITEISAQYESEKKALQEKIDRVSKAQTWDDLK